MNISGRALLIVEIQLVTPLFLCSKRVLFNLFYLICVLRYTTNRIGNTRQNRIKYKGIMTVTPPQILPPIWYRLKSSRFLLIESSWSGNRVIILANDSSRPTKGGMQVKINGIVIANTVECALAETSIASVAINRLPMYPPKVLSR